MLARASLLGSIAAAVLMCCFPCVAEVTTQPDNIASLIEQLGDINYRVREAAQEALIELGADAEEALEAATTVGDLEVSSRAKMALEAIRSSRTHRAVDGDGKSINGATLEIISKDYVTQEETSLGVFKTGPGGCVSISDLAPIKGGRLYAILVHPKMSRARAPIDMPGNGQRVQFPVVPSGCESYDRSLRGQVVDIDGKAATEVTITCSEVRTPGEGLIQAYNDAAVLTDEKGNFSIYVPNNYRKEERGKLIPPNSRFNLFVQPSQASGLFPQAIECRNNLPARIVLERPQRFHTFKFEKPGGGFLEGEVELKDIHLAFSKQGKNTGFGLDKRYLTEGGKLANGFYSALLVPGENVRYMPVEVTDTSPEQLVFRLPPPLIYRGKVIVGETNAPLAGAFVFACQAIAHNNFALLSDEDWAQLEELPANCSAKSPEAAVLGKLYSFSALTRTDERGCYEVSLPPGQKAYNIIAFARDRLAFSQRILELIPDTQRPAELADLPLFAAARVLVRPEVGNEHVSIGHDWAIQDDEQPELAAKILKLNRRYSGDRNFERLHWLKENEQQALYVPAGVRMKMVFLAPYHEKWMIVGGDESFVLQQGQTKDLGVLNIVPAARIVISVIDEQGRPVEGIPLRIMLDGSNSWCVAHNTDAKGMATFYAPCGSAGNAAVIDFPNRSDPAGKAPNLTVKFQAAKDAAKINSFKIGLTAQQIELLLGKKTTKPASAASSKSTD